MENAAGSLISVFDTALTAHANWTVHDAAAAANAKVYKCAGDVTFYVYIGDNQTNYSNIVVWAAWDAGTHTGSGSTTTNGTLCKYYEGYAIYVNDNRFVYVNVGLTGASSYGHYCGLINRADTSKNLVLVHSGSTSTYYKSYNALAGYGSSSYVRCQLMEDVDGNSNVAAYPIAYSTSETTRFLFDLDGRPHVYETPMWYGSSNPRNFIGWLDGVMCLRTTPVASPFWANDIITVDGMDWAMYSEGTTTQNRFLVRERD